MVCKHQNIAVRSLEARAETCQKAAKVPFPLLYISRRMTHAITDITIIGGGPTGLFASFYTGMRGATAQIVDALPELGGQLTALYPEKYIFDVGGFAKILAKDLVKALKEQVEQFHHKAHLNQNVVAL